MDNLRISSFDNFIGQKNVVERLKISIESAQKRNDVLSHVLFDGPAGCGKTTLAKIVSELLNVSIHITNGGNLRSTKKLLPCLSKITSNCVLFIDEIHRLSPHVMDIMLNVLEDFKLYLVDDGETITIDLPKFTLIGATTQGGKLIKPFYDRFPIKCQLETYSKDDIVEIINHNQTKLKLNLNDDIKKEIAKRSRGVPRVVNNLLMWIRDYILHKQLSNINLPILNESLQLIDIDEVGLDLQDRRYVNTLKTFDGGPIGVDTIAASSGLDKDTILNKVEPYLLKLQLIGKCSKGRFLIK